MAEQQNQDMQTPSQYPTATRIDNGVAYDVAGKQLGPVNDGEQAAPEKKGDDFFSKLGGQEVKAQPQQQGDDFFTKLGGQEVKAEKKPGFLKGLWDKVNTGLISKDTFVGAMTGLTPDQLDKELEPYADETPTHAAFREFTRGVYQDLGGTASSFTSPLSIATLSAGSAGKIPGAIGTVAKAVTGAASVGFTAQGIKDMLDSGMTLNDVQKAMHLEGDPEKFQKFLQGAGMSVLGTVGVYESRGALRTNKQALDAAHKMHASTERVVAARSHEVDLATQQAADATDAAEKARNAEFDGTGTHEQTIEAENQASAAAANAKKAQTALKDAHEAHGNAGVERARLQRKVNKAEMKVSEKQTHEAAGASEDLHKIAPSAPHGPASYSLRDEQVVRGYLEDHHQSVQNINTKQGLFDSLDYIQKGMENKVKPYVEKYAYEPISSDVVRDVRDGLADSPQASFVENGMNSLLEKYPQLEENPTIQEAEKIRADLNSINRGELNSKWGRRLDDALKGDPDFAARYYAAESLRNGIYGTFEEKGVQGIRELRQDESSIIRVRNAVERNGLHKGPVALRGSRESGSLRKAAAWATQKTATMLGAKFGGPWGAAAAESAHPTIGKMIAPGDMTHDQIVERMMKPKVADVPITEISGPGLPSTATPREIGLSPKDMQHVQREYGPLHAELATHYGESVGDSSYSDLEKRFSEDIQDKQFHGVSLESSEKSLLKQINQQNASDLLEAREAAKQDAVTGKNIGKYNLPDRVEPILQAPGKLANGMTTREALVHDLAHVVVGSERGLSFEDGIRSHGHPANKGTGRVMSAPINFEPFMNEEGEIDFGKLSKQMPDIVATYVAGGVANDLFHDVPFTENHALGADYDVMKSFMKKAGFSELEASKMIAQAAEDAATVLSRPGMRDILEGHAGLREAGLNEKYHFSPERLEQVLQDVKEGTKRESTTGKSSGANGEGDQPTSKPGTGTEGKIKSEPSENIRKESKGSTEDKEGGSGKRTESSSSASTGEASTPESNDPAFAVTGPQGGHAGGGVSSVEELNRPGRFVKIGRGGAITDQNKVPDFNLGPGEAGYQVLPDGTYKLSAGQETPATKRGVEGYAKEKYGKNAALQPAFASHTPGMPPERSTGVPEFDEAIKAGGGIPGGLQKGDPEINLPDLALFHDPQSGSTLALRSDDVTAASVERELKKSRAMYAAAAERKVAQTKAAQGEVSTAADEFNRREGREKINTETHPHDVEFAKRTANAYDTLTHNPVEPKTKAAYDALKKDVDKQWDYATNDMGIKFEPWAKEGQPYANSKEMVEDVKNNKHLYFFRGGELPEGNPLAQADPKTGLTYNDKFRAIHDLFGHAAQGNQFGPKGEETAYQLHRQMFSSAAVPALTTETRGQNSWVNYGKHLRNSEGQIPVKGEQGFVPATERPYAQQKTGLLPDEFHAAKPATMLDRAVQHYGLTDEPRKTGYILPNGRGLDFSDGQSARTLDHGDVSGVMGGELPRGENPREVFATQTGAIRFLQSKGETSIVVPGKNITPEQIQFISRAVNQHPLGAKNLRIDLIDQNGKYIGDSFGRGDSMEAVKNLIGEATAAKDLSPAFSSEIEKSKEGQLSTNAYPDWAEAAVRAIRGTEKRVSGKIDLGTGPLPDAADMQRVGEFVYKYFEKKLPADFEGGVDPGKWARVMLHLFPGENIFGKMNEVLGKIDPKYNKFNKDKTIDVSPTNTDDLSPAFASPAASTVPLMQNPLNIKGTGDNGKISTMDVAKALNNFTKKQVPALKLGKAEPAEQVERAKSIADDEARYQLAQNNTGETWYTKDMAVHDKVLQDMRPELENPAKLSMFKMVEAVLSSGQKPYANFKSAVKAWDYYHEHGEFPPTNPDTNMSWGPRGPVAYSNAIDIINRLIKEKGEQGASDWLMGDHTVKELREYNNAKRGGRGGGVDGKQDDILPGVMVLGPKRGPFAQNLHGQASAFTADMWVARSWNRWMGTTEINPDGEIETDRPRSVKERDLIKQSFQETAKNLNLTTSALQAVLWYYEQGLYDVHGSPKESWSFSDAAKRVADEEFNSFKFGEEK